MRYFLFIGLFFLLCSLTSAQNSYTQTGKEPQTFSQLEIKTYTFVSHVGQIGARLFYYIGDDSSLMQIDKEEYIDYLMNYKRFNSVKVPIDEDIDIVRWDNIVKNLKQNKSLKKLTFVVGTNGSLNKILEKTDFSWLTNLREISIICTTESELKIPESIYKIKNLKILKINRSKIKEISDKISNLKNLEILELNDNDLSELPDEFGDLKKLRVLDLGKNHFSEIPSCIFNLKNLEYLDISENGLKKIDKSLYDIKNLTFLKLSNRGYTLPNNRNEIKILPNGISKLSHLKSLNLEGNPIEYFPDDLDQLKKLKYLNLGESTTVSFFQSYNFPLLDTLILSDTKIDSIPDNIAQYKSLKFLDLNNSNLVYISDRINDLKMLETLFVKDIYIERHLVTNSIKKDINIRYSYKTDYDIEFAKNHPSLVKSIKLSYKDIINLGDDILKFTQLKKLELVNLRMDKEYSSFVSSINLSDLFKKLATLENLEELRYYYSDWYNKEYKVSIEGIEQLENLKIFEMSQMLLTEFPVEICKLKNLEKLVINFNKFEVLPDELSNLKQLKYIDLRRNCLKDFPKSLCRIDELEYIDLRNNNIKEIPIEVLNLNNLRKIYLNNIRNRDGYDGACFNQVVSILPELKELVTKKVLVTD